MKVALYKTLTFFCFSLIGFFSLKGQNQIAQQTTTKTVSLVAMTIDSIDTPQKYQLVAGIFNNHKEVENLDIKKRKCNFTLRDQTQPALLDRIVNQLTTSGFRVEVTSYRSNMILSEVPYENHQR